MSDDYMSEVLWLKVEREVPESEAPGGSLYPDYFFVPLHAVRLLDVWACEVQVVGEKRGYRLSSDELYETDFVLEATLSQCPEEEPDAARLELIPGGRDAP